MEEKKKLKVLPIRIDEETLVKWRKLAHWHETSMAELIRHLVNEKIKESKRC